MPAVPNNGLLTAEIQVRGLATAGGSLGRNFNFIFHYRRISSPLVADELVFEAAFNAGVTPSLLACLNARYTQSVDDVRFVEDATRAVVTVPRAGVGGVAGDSMPLHMAGYVLMRQGFRGRGVHGSKHLGPLSEADTTAGTDDIFNAAAIARFTTFRTAAIAALVDANGITWQPCILSRVKPAQYRKNPTNVITNSVTQVLLNKRVGRMRKREVPSVY